MNKHKMNNKKLIEKCNEIKAKKRASNNGIEDKEEYKEEKWYYLFNNEMKLFVDEFKITIPSFVLKRKDTYILPEKSDYVFVIVKEEEKQKTIETQVNGLKNSESEIIIEEKKDLNEIQIEIQNGGIDNEDN